MSCIIRFLYLFVEKKMSLLATLRALTYAARCIEVFVYQRVLKMGRLRMCSFLSNGVLGNNTAGAQTAVAHCDDKASTFVERFTEVNMLIIYGPISLYHPDSHVATRSAPPPLPMV